MMDASSFVQMVEQREAKRQRESSRCSDSTAREMAKAEVLLLRQARYQVSISHNISKYIS
eukprot:SAG31_NODE_1509_length_8062_cov_6.974884_1_plen_60_part_00